MIEGFKLRVTSGELEGHCRERAYYHRQRADVKEADLPALKETMERLKSGGINPVNLSSMGGKSGYHLDAESPVESLEKDIRDHRNKALVFDFFAEHLFQEDYTLKEEDLVRLEILKR